MNGDRFRSAVHMLINSDHSRMPSDWYSQIKPKTYIFRNPLIYGQIRGFLKIARETGYEKPGEEQRIVNFILKSDVNNQYSTYFLRIDYYAYDKLGDHNWHYLLMPDGGYNLRETDINDINIKSVFKQIIDAVNYIHTLGVAHLDIKPGNILYDRLRGTIKIIDFGFAIQLKPDMLIRGRRGTKQYMAPEILQYQFYDAQSADIYCLGACLLLLLVKNDMFLYIYERMGEISVVSSNIYQIVCEQNLLSIVRDVYATHGYQSDVIDEVGIDLCQRMFRQEEYRISMEDIYQHEWWQTN